jgi:prepilin-type N-terminal cleavage/methylation domain-containing protein
MGFVKEQGGFTLVEVMIVLGITGLALAGILLGQGAQLQNAQFSADIDSLVNKLKEVQNEATQGVSYQTTGSPTNGTSSSTFAGKELDGAPPPNSNTALRSRTLIDAPGGCPAGSSLSNDGQHCATNSVIISYGQGITVQSVNCNWVQFLYPVSGQESSIRTSTGNPCDVAFTDGGTHTATVTFDPLTNSITRTAQ